MDKFQGFIDGIKKIPFMERLLQRPVLFKIATNTGWLFAEKLFKLVIGLFVSAWVTRYLGPARYGDFSYVVAFVTLFTPISGLGLANIVVRELVSQPDRKNEILGTSLIMQLIASFIVYALSLVIAIFLKTDIDKFLVFVAILSGMLVFQAWNSTFVHWFQSQVRAKYNIWARSIALVLLSGIRVRLILSNASLEAFFWALLFEVIITGILMTWYYISTEGHLFSIRIDVALAKKLIHDSWPIILSGLAAMIYMKIDKIIMGNIGSSEDLGLYSSAVQISELWYFIPVALGTSFFPAIIQSKESKSAADYHRRMQLFFDFMVGISYLIIAVTYIFAPLIIKYLYGSAFYGSIPLLRIHIGALMFVSIGIGRSQWLMVENRTQIIMASTILGAIANIGLNIWWIPRFGGVGAAWATMISYSISAYLSTLFMPKSRELFIKLTLSILMPFRILSIWKSFRKYVIKS